jgi:hypothetical protein
VVGLLVNGMQQRMTSSAEWQDLLGGIALLALIVPYF